MPSAHHPALLFTHSGMPAPVFSVCPTCSTEIIPTLIRYCRAATNSSSVVMPSAHHPALLFTHSGMDSAMAGAAATAIARTHAVITAFIDDNCAFSVYNLVPTM